MRAEAPVKALAGFKLTLDSGHAARAAALKAVLYSRRRPIVSSSYLPVLLDYHGPNVPGQAVGSKLRDLGLQRKIRIPVWSLHHASSVANAIKIVCTLGEEVDGFGLLVLFPRPLARPFVNALDGPKRKDVPNSFAFHFRSKHVVHFFHITPDIFFRVLVGPCDNVHEGIAPVLVYLKNLHQPNFTIVKSVL